MTTMNTETVKFLLKMVYDGLNGDKSCIENVLNEIQLESQHRIQEEESVVDENTLSNKSNTIVLLSSDDSSDSDSDYESVCEFSDDTSDYIEDGNMSILSIQVSGDNISTPSIPNTCFSNDDDCVNQMIKELENLEELVIVPHRHKTKSNHYYTVKNKDDSKKIIIIENHNEGIDTHPGIISTHRGPSGCKKNMDMNYSDESERIMKQWDKYGKSRTRRCYDYRGKNKKETLDLIKKILS